MLPLFMWKEKGERKEKKREGRGKEVVFLKKGGLLFVHSTGKRVSYPQY